MPIGATDNQADRLADEVDRLQRRINRLEAELDRSQRLASLGAVCAIIAHEFNNILTPVSTYAQLAMANPDDADLSRKALTKAVRNVDKASAISGSLLGLARGGEDQPTADVAEAVNEALGCLARPLEKDGIALEQQVAPGLTAAIRSVALQQVVLNLTLNAREAMRPEGGRLSIAAKRSTWNAHSDQSAIRLIVEDTGGGIPAEMLEHIFEPLVGGENEQNADEEPSRAGAGLGLAICKRLVDEAGGWIGVENEPHRGARFIVLLPIVAAEAEAAAA